MAKHELNYGVIVDSLEETIAHNPVSHDVKSINEEIYNEDKRTYELEIDYEFNNSSNDDY